MSKNKIAVITGATGRIGSVFYKELLNLNYDIYILSNNQSTFRNLFKNIPKNYSKKIYRVKFNLLSNNSINKAISRIKKKNRKIDCLINCAAASNRGKFYKYNFKNLNSEFMGVFGASFYLTEKLLPLLRNSKNGKIINVGSLWGVSSPDFKTYLDLDIGPSAITSTCKAALMHYTKFLSSRESEYNLSINNLVPGWFPRKGKKERKDYINSINRKIPLKRIGKLKDLETSVRFLLSDETKYFNGQNLIVDGGYSIF